jgi:hypothetical protein
MNLDSLVRKICKWAFLKLEDTMTMRKSYRAENFGDEMQVINTYRNLCIEISLEHALDTITLVCRKEDLTKEEKGKNKQAKKEIHRRGDKPYLLIGVIDDGYKGYEGFTPENGENRLQLRMHSLFNDLKKFYIMYPDSTHPVLLSIRTVADTDEELDKYKEKTKIHYIRPTYIMPFLMEFGRRTDEGQESERQSRMADYQ